MNLLEIPVNDCGDVPKEVVQLLRLMDRLAYMARLFIPKELRIMMLSDWEVSKDEDTEDEHDDISSTFSTHNGDTLQEDTRTQLEDRSPGWWKRKKERNGN